VPVEQNTTYSFSAWLISAFPNNPAILTFAINGVAIGAPLTASTSTCIWELFAADWNSGNATTAEICIVNQNTGIFGNDFALDDISFTAVCSHTASISVEVGQSLMVDLGPDVLLCGDNVLLLDPGYPGAQVVWQDGSTASTYTVTASGDYTVEVSQNGCSGSDAITVQFVAGPAVEITGNTVLCEPEGTVLTAVTDATTITWQDGSTGMHFTAFSPGIYSVTVETEGCMDTDQVEVIPGEPPMIDLGPDTTVCEPVPIIITATATAGATITWQDESTGQSFVAGDAGIYHATISNGCGTASDSLLRLMAVRSSPMPFHPMRMASMMFSLWLAPNWRITISRYSTAGENAFSTVPIRMKDGPVTTREIPHRWVSTCIHFNSEAHAALLV
jgi:hypothetical protein